MCTKNLRVGITAGNLNLSFYYIMLLLMTVLFASTAGDLQLQLNVMNQWCYIKTPVKDHSVLCQQYDSGQIRSYV